MYRPFRGRKTGMRPQRPRLHTPRWSMGTITITETREMHPRTSKFNPTRRWSSAGGRIPNFPSLGSNRTGFQPYSSRILRTWGVAPGWYCVGALPLLPRLALPRFHPAHLEKKIHPASTRCGATMREAPKARLYTSLGQRPRSPAQNRPGLKARLIPCIIT